MQMPQYTGSIVGFETRQVNKQIIGIVKPSWYTVLSSSLLK